MLTQLRQLVLANFDHLQWRHHGIGVLQAYLHEGTEPEFRVHVWHPALARPGINESGDCHDHRFDLRSTILAGYLEENFYGEPTPSLDGPWGMYTVENARAAGPEKNFDGACLPIKGRFSAVGDYRVYSAGCTYSHPRGTFHRTMARELAVTFCAMSEKRGQARLLVPYGREPVHAFGEPAPQELQNRILSEARHALHIQPRR